MLNFRAGGFDCDEGNQAKCQKHRVSIPEIEDLFAHRLHIAPDPKHSREEDRLIAAGRTSAGRPLFVAFTIRAQNKRLLIRPVSARYMHAKEIAAYDKASVAAEESTPPENGPAS